MPGLADDEDHVVAALFDPLAHVPTPLGDIHGFRARGRFRDNDIAALLIRALAARYPAVRRLAGDESFLATARRFVLAQPPHLSAVLHFGELERFVELAREAEPIWLLVAGLCQAATYVCAAAVWHRALREGGVPRRLASIVPLGLAKLFTDQALPSGGISGTLLAVSGLARRGVPARIGMAALLVGLVSFYAAYLLEIGRAHV